MCVLVHEPFAVIFSESEARALDSWWSMIFSDPPSPAEASI